MARHESRRPAPLANRPPDHESRRDLVLSERPAPPDLMARLVVPGQNSYLRLYSLGECSVVVTREFGRWHMSIAHPRRYPTWEEVSRGWYRAIPGAASMCGAMPLPPAEDYINVHSYCFHVVENRDPEFIL